MSCKESIPWILTFVEVIVYRVASNSILTLIGPQSAAPDSKEMITELASNKDWLAAHPSKPDKPKPTG